jgi:hypothetical protein
MVVIHTAYATMKMPSPKGMITIKADQRNALVCENATLTHARQFGEKEVQEQAAKVAKTHGGSTPFKSPVPKPMTTGSPRPPLGNKGTYGASTSRQPPPISRWTIRRRRLTIKKFQLTPETQTRTSRSAQALRPNRNSRSSLFSRKICMSSHGKYQICPGSPGR